jgi:hypothetical protein
MTRANGAQRDGARRKFGHPARRETQIAVHLARALRLSREEIKLTRHCNWIEIERRGNSRCPRARCIGC